MAQERKYMKRLLILLIKKLKIYSTNWFKVNLREQYKDCILFVEMDANSDVVQNLTSRLPHEKHTDKEAQ